MAATTVDLGRIAQLYTELLRTEIRGHLEEIISEECEEAKNRIEARSKVFIGGLKARELPTVSMRVEQASSRPTILFEFRAPP